MATSQDPPSIRAVISPDGLSAELVIPADSEPPASVESCVDVLRQAGVVVDEAVISTVAALLEHGTHNSGSLRGIVARGQAPQAGQDGRIEWLVNCPKDDATLSFYDRSSYTMVTKDQVLARIIAPVVGTAGRDVLGQVIAAPTGNPVDVRLHESILQDAHGQLVALTHGALDNSSPVWRVQRLISVKEWVDFSSGNIDFHGDVVIGTGVRALFTVKATGTVKVGQIIEAATVECGGDLITGGMAGGEHGRVKIGGNFVSRYLENVVGDVTGDLCVSKSIVNCTLVIHGAMRCAGAVLIGGRQTVVGDVDVASLGNSADLPTELVLGCVPRLEPIAAEVDVIHHKLQAQHGSLLAEQTQLESAHCIGPSAQVRERLTEIAFELPRITRSLAKARAAQEKLRHDIAALRTVHATVRRCLHAGTVITLRGQSWRIREDIAGPVIITCQQDGSLVVGHGRGSSLLLTQIADPSGRREGKRQ
ncbi:MAG: FapA family protein [Phycisphaeraceae bacterium]